MDFYPPSFSFPTAPPTMDQPGPPVNHPIHPSPWFQSQQTAQSTEQYIPSTMPSYASNTLPSTSYTQDSVFNYNHEFEICEQQTIADILGPVVNDSRQLTIPLELLNQQTTFETLPWGRELEEIIFLGPDTSSIDFFLNMHTVTRAAIHLLKHVRSLKKITFSLDFTDLTMILKTLAVIPDMQEIELTLPTASKIKYLSMEMVYLQNAFIDGLKFFQGLKRLTIPIEFVTSLLLSHLAVLSDLKSLTVKSSPPPSHHHQFPACSSYAVPADLECPGSVFLAHLNFDPRGYFRQLSRLDLGAPLSDAMYTKLRTLFPQAYICHY